MNIASMFLRILAILGALAAAAMFWLIGNEKEELQTELQGTQSRLSQTEGQVRTISAERDELEEGLAELNTELEETRANANRLSNELVQVRRDLQQAQQAATTQQQEAETLRSEAAQIRRQLLDERSRIAQLEESLESDDATDLHASIRELERQLLERERQLQTLPGDETAQNDRPQQPAREVIRGEVAEIGSDSPFVLLNIGSDQGVRQNSSVMIRRGPRYIGRAVIAEVNEDNSVAEILSGRGNVRPGDLAVTLN